jgi:hypothetical protein
MVASLLKLLTTGIQDERLAYKDTFYPFAKVWQTTGRFTTQWVRLDFESTPTFGSTHFLRLLRKGHLLTRLFLVSEMPSLWEPQAAAEAAAAAAGTAFVGPKFGWTNSLGHALIDSMTMSIGNTQVEQLDGRLLEMLDEYTVPLEKTTTVNRLIKRKEDGFSEDSFGRSPQPVTVYTPLPFWFARGDPGCALPIDAIQHDEVRIGVRFRGLQGLYYTDSRNVGLGGEGAEMGGRGGEGGGEGSALWPLGNSKFYRADAGGSVVPGLRADNPLVTEISGITMPALAALPLGETYMLAEYVYVDQPEANRFRLADLQVPIVQHYPLQPFSSRGLPTARIPLRIPNPTRDLYWMCQRVEAPSYNAYFLATRDLSNNAVPVAPWWPNAQGLQGNQPGFLVPGFAYRNSEPLRGAALVYEGSLVRWRTQAPAAFRSVLPSWEMKKSPWINRYFYNLSFGLWNGYTAFTRARGEANLDKIMNMDMLLEFAPRRGSNNPSHVPTYMVYSWAETYNLLRVYGGRAGLLFAY